MATTVTRSVTAKALAGPKTLHPVALRKLGVKVPEVPELAESPAVVPKETPFSPPSPARWDEEEYSPTTPSKEVHAAMKYASDSMCAMLDSLALPSASVYEAIGKAEVEWDDHPLRMYDSVVYPEDPCPAPLKCNFGSREHVQWIIDTTK